MFDVQNDKNVKYIWLYFKILLLNKNIYILCAVNTQNFIISGEKVPLREVVVIVSVLYIIWSFSNGVLKVKGQQSGGEKIPDGDNT